MFFCWQEEQEPGNFVDSGRMLQFKELAGGGGGMDFSSFSAHQPAEPVPKLWAPLGTSP